MVLPFLNGTKGLNRLLGFFWLLLLCSPYVCCKISYRHYQYVLWNACCACNTILLLHWSEITQFQVIELSSRSPFKRNGRGQTWRGLSFSIVHTEVRTHSNARVTMPFPLGLQWMLPPSTTKRYLTTGSSSYLYDCMQEKRRWWQGRSLPGNSGCDEEESNWWPHGKAKGGLPFAPLRFRRPSAKFPVSDPRARKRKGCPFGSIWPVPVSPPLLRGSQAAEATLHMQMQVSRKREREQNSRYGSGNGI